MRVQQFRAQVTADSRGRAVIVVPFDPDEEWGVKAVHHVNGMVNGCWVRVTIAPGDGGWAFTLNPRLGLAVGSDAVVEVAPEGPQRSDLAEDISAALAANPARCLLRHTGAVLPQGLHPLHRCDDPAARPPRGSHSRGSRPARERDQGTTTTVNAVAAHQDGHGGIDQLPACRVEIVPCGHVEAFLQAGNVLRSAASLVEAAAATLA